MINLKLLQAFTKILPIILSILFVIRSYISFTLEIDIIECSILGGAGFIPLLYLWYASKVFKFCLHQLMFLYYMIFSNILCTLDTYDYLPLSNYQYFLVVMVTFGLNVLFYGILKHYNNKQMHKKHLYYKNIIKVQQELINKIQDT